MKIQWVKAVKISIVGLIFMVVLLMRSINAQGGAVDGMEGIKIDHPLDVVIILDESMNIAAEYYDGMVKMTRQFPDHFIMGENDTRLAIITYAAQSHIRLNLTSDSNLIRSVDLKRLSHPGSPELIHALNDVKDKVFLNERPKAKKVIIIILEGTDWRPKEAADAAKKLQQAGFLIYAIAIGQTYHINPTYSEFVRFVTGNSSRVGYITNPSDFDPKQVFERAKEMFVCEYEKGCRFVEPEGNDCRSAWWNPFMVTKTNCTISLPDDRPKHSCPRSSCNEICDKKWPWESDHSCQEEDAGKNKTLKRHGPKPTANGHMRLENCPSVKHIFCPPLTKKPTQPSQTGENPITPTKQDGEGVDNATGKPESAEVELLVIVIGIIVGLLCLGLIIVVILLTKRKRKKDAEKAAAMKAALEKSSPKSKSGKKSEARSSGKLAMVEHGPGGGERAVGANLPEDSALAKREASVSEKSTKGNVLKKK